MPETKSLTYAGAVNAALVRALEELPEVLLFGEDVALPGGVFGVTKGLRKRFGERVFDTPISEAAILGGALGASLVGRRPIAEIMWIDFALVALDQLVNQAANVRYVSRGELRAPMTVRTQQGSAPGACAQHSQSLEALFAHIPGLQVCMPATPQDAHDLLLASVYSDDPAIVIENRTLYHSLQSEVVLDAEVPPIGGAAVRRAGRDATVVTWGAVQAKVLEAAELLARDGFEVEVLDMRWLRPFDRDAVLASVQRTGRLVVVHDAHVFAGLGAEVVSSVVEAGCDLHAPPRRVGVPDARIPAAPSLAAALMPSVSKIIEALESVLKAGGQVWAGRVS
jgi:pyruvate dehydrogenase E1 component beta subunit